MLAAAVAIAAIGTAQSDEKHSLPKPSTSPQFEAMKKLVGDWVVDDGNAKADSPVVSSFKLISNGSVLHETLFPGAAHEMVTVYHMDGPDLICTHYCALGNQPKLKMQAGKDPKVLTFRSFALGNSKSMDDAHMGMAKITLVDGDHYIAEWKSLINQKIDESHSPKFSLVRKPKK
jgi:hypothetical protein